MPLTRTMLQNNFFRLIYVANSWFSCPMWFIISKPIIFRWFISSTGTWAFDAKFTILTGTNIPHTTFFYAGPIVLNPAAIQWQCNEFDVTWFENNIPTYVFLHYFVQKNQFAVLLRILFSNHGTSNSLHYLCVAMGG